MKRLPSFCILAMHCSPQLAPTSPPSLKDNTIYSWHRSYLLPTIARKITCRRWDWDCLGPYTLKLDAEQTNWMFEKYFTECKSRQRWQRCCRGLQKWGLCEEMTRRLWNYLLSIAKFPVVVLHLTEAKGFIYRFIKNDKNEGTLEFHQGEKWDYGCLSFVQSSICGSPG